MCFVLNNCWNDTINDVPIRAANGTTNDISPLLYFRFYEPVYYHVDDAPFPSGSKEKRGRWVGISENVGNYMTFLILTDDTQKIIHRSNIRTATDPTSKNLRMDPLNEEFKAEPPEIVRSKNRITIHSPSFSSDQGEPDSAVPSPDDESPTGAAVHPPTAAVPPPNDVLPGKTENPPGPTSLPTSSMAYIDPDDFVGRTFLLDEQEDGSRKRAKIVECINDHESDLKNDPDFIKFRCAVDEDTYGEIITYNELMDFLQKNEEQDVSVTISKYLFDFQLSVGNNSSIIEDNQQHQLVD